MSSSQSAWLRFVVAAHLVALVAGCAPGDAGPARGGAGSSAPPTSAVSPPTSAVSPPTVSSTAPTTAPPASVEPSSAPCGWASTRPAGSYDHVVWIWFENHTTAQVIGSRSAPYTTAIARQCGTATRYAAVGSPSLPNYIAATSGDTQGIRDDAPPASHRLETDNLFRLVRASGRSERSYVESMPVPCATVSSGRYAVKHNPAAYYVGGTDREACIADDVPLGTPEQGALATDIDRDTLPAFAFVTPDLCNDTHDCPVSTGDQWLGVWLPRLLDSAAYRSGRTAIFLVWDEPTPMPHVVIAPSTPPGTTLTAPVDHYALLRTTQELLGLVPLLGHAAEAPSTRDAWNL